MCCPDAFLLADTVIQRKSSSLVLEKVAAIHKNVKDLGAAVDVGSSSTDRERSSDFDTTIGLNTSCLLDPYDEMQKRRMDVEAYQMMKKEDTKKKKEGEEEESGSSSSSSAVV